MTWSSVTLGEVVELNYGKPLPDSGRSENGPVPVFGANGVKAYSERSLHQGPSVIIGRKGSAGEINRADGPFWPLDVTYFTTHDHNRLDFDFLEYALRRMDLPSLAKGVKPGINRNEVYALPLPLPPLEEQKRIVAMLDQAFAALDRARALVETNLVDSAAIDQAIIDTLTDSSISGEYRQSLNDLCDLIVDCEHKTAPLSQSDIASIRTPNIGKGRLLLDGVNTVSEEVYRLWSRRAVPAPGDLILAREAPAGNVGVIPEGLRCVLGQRTVLIRPKASEVHSDFLALYLLNTKTQRRLLSHSTGATVQHVNMKDIRALPIETLPPIDLQLELVRKSEVLRTSASRAESDYRSKAESIKTLRKALLQKAFAGELT